MDRYLIDPEAVEHRIANIEHRAANTQRKCWVEISRNLSHIYIYIYIYRNEDMNP